MVFHIQKKNVGLTTESLLPYTQLNAEVNESVSTSINQLFVLLERKKSEAHTYLQHNYSIVGMKKASVQELGNIEEVMRLYNTAVEPYLGMKTSLTQTTKKTAVIQHSEDHATSVLFGESIEGCVRNTEKSTTSRKSDCR